MCNTEYCTSIAKNNFMKITLPDIKSLIKKILPVKASFAGDFIHPALGQTATQTIEQWRLNYLKELKCNNLQNSIGKFNIFITSLLLRASKGEIGGKLYDELRKQIKNYEDINKKNLRNILRETGYRFQNQGIETTLNFKVLFLKKYKGVWENYFKEAKKNYKNNFLADDFLKIKGIGFKVRDLALSCFLKEYSANDFHVVDVLTRTGLIVYGYGNLDFGTNPNNNKNYLFLRNLIIKLSEQSGYSSGELDRIFWHFGRAICKSRPDCENCPVQNMCLTYRNKINIAD